MQPLTMARQLAALGCFIVAIGWVAGCGEKTSSLTTPTAPSVTVAALTITGSGALTAPGQTSQLSAQATFPDGSKQDVTTTAHWASSDQRVATVSPSGLVTAVDFGKTTITANSGPPVFQAPSFTVIVLPEGTYILAGRVEEAVDFPLKDVRIEVIGGPMSGRVVMTDWGGWYAFNGVTGVLQVRASKDGYVPATQNVSSDTEHVNFELITSVPYAAIGGVYRLTFTAAASCQLPDDARHRTYTATIDQRGANATVTLTDARFYTDGYCGPMNSFDAHVHGNTVSLANYGGDCGIVEQLADMRYLSLWGTAEAIGTDPISAAFNGSVSIAAVPPDGSNPIATCTAPDHQLVFERTFPTASGPQGIRLGRERTK